MMTADLDDIDMTGRYDLRLLRRVAAGLLALVLIASSATMFASAEGATDPIATAIAETASQDQLEHCQPTPSDEQKGCTIHCLSWYISSAPAIIAEPKPVRRGVHPAPPPAALIWATPAAFAPGLSSSRLRASGPPPNQSGKPLYAQTQRIRL